MTKTLSTIILSFATLINSCGYSSDQHTSVTLVTDTANIPPKIKLVTDSEPGERMVISGTVYLPDAKTPVNNAILSVWHTDSNGYYIIGGGGAGEEDPRIHGRMKTGVDGKYEFRTIKPAPYPTNTTPSHIHAHISASHYPEYALIYYFEGDKLITDQNRSELNNHRGGTTSIIELTKDSKGILTGHRDIILEYVKPTNETMKLKW